MFGLWKSKKRKAQEEKSDLKAIVTEDLLGASEWKESKFGYLTGLSAIGNIGSSITSNIAQSFGRLSILFKFMSQKDSLPSLPEVSTDEFDGKRRFAEATRLHNRKERDINIAMRNTRRSAFLYAFICVFAILYFISALIVKGNLPITTYILHVTPIFVFAALTFKAAYYNWIFRLRTLDNPKVFIRSLDWLPKS